MTEKVHRRELEIYIEENVFEIGIDDMAKFPDDSGQLNNVLEGLRDEFFAIASSTNSITFGDKSFNLIYINGKNKTRGFLLQLDLLAKFRNEYVMNYSKFLSNQFRKVDEITMFNHWQSSIRTILEKEGYMTYGDELLPKLENSSIILKGKKGIEYVPFCDRFEVLTQFMNSKPQIKADTNYVYLQLNSDNYTKIGRSKNPIYREATLQSKEPDIKLISYWEAPSSIEKELHKEFFSKRIRGEWFDLIMSDYSKIKERMKEYYSK